jgi:predicted nucleotidyltransferase
MERADPALPLVPEGIQEPFRTILEAAATTWCAELGERLLSLVLFGSVARGQARPASDLDLLIVANGFPRSLRDRRRPFLDSWARLRADRGLPAVEWNLVTKSPQEAVVHSPLYLDLVEDAVFILDRGNLVASVLDQMRRRMRELGSRRVQLESGGWYWDLKPDFRFGDVIEI